MYSVLRVERAWDKERFSKPRRLDKIVSHHVFLKIRGAPKGTGCKMGTLNSARTVGELLNFFHRNIEDADLRVINRIARWTVVGRALVTEFDRVFQTSNHRKIQLQIFCQRFTKNTKNTNFIVKLQRTCV